MIPEGDWVTYDEVYRFSDAGDRIRREWLADVQAKRRLSDHIHIFSTVGGGMDTHTLPFVVTPHTVRTLVREIHAYLKKWDRFRELYPEDA